MGESRFELLKRDATDLQSAPFGHSGTLPYKEPPIKRFVWSWWTDSNPRPADYKSAALPTELHQHLTHTTRILYHMCLPFVNTFFHIFFEIFLLFFIKCSIFYQKIGGALFLHIHIYSIIYKTLDLFDKIYYN